MKHRTDSGYCAPPADCSSDANQEGRIPFDSEYPGKRDSQQQGRRNTYHGVDKAFLSDAEDLMKIHPEAKPHDAGLE
ncbi:MAG: hypothetical protein NVS1B11_05790 [Terriglobales bacterium]